MNASTEAGVNDTVWRRWKECSSEDEYIVTDKIVWDEAHEICVQFLCPLGRGVSGTVFVIRIVDSVKHAQIKNFIYSLKVFKTNEAAIAQGQNEMMILPFCHRSFNTAASTTFPKYLASFKIGGHLSFLMELGGPSIIQALSLRKFKGFPLPVVKKILSKILGALSEMENKGLVHGDIKPENILFSFRKFGQLTSFKDYSDILANFTMCLLNDDWDAISSNGSIDIMLIDWSASSIGYNQVALYMQSRYYRAPEIIMRSNYGPAIDVWSSACVAVEMFIGRPLFQGENEIEMLVLIQQRLGIFPQSVIKKMGDDSVAKSDDSWRMSPDQYSPGNFEAYIREESKREDVDVLLFINIMRLMLQLNQDARTTASSALIHPFITGSMKARKRRQSLRTASLPKNL